MSRRLDEVGPGVGMPARESMARSMLLALGIGSWLLTGIIVINMTARAAAFVTWWQVLSTAVILAACAVLIGARKIPMRALRVTCYTVGAAVLIRLAALPLAYAPDVDPTIAGPPSYSFAVIGATAIAAACRPRIVIVYVLALGALIVGSAAVLPVAPVMPVLDGLLQIFLAALCASIAVATLRAGELLDAANAEALAEAQDAARERARSLESLRLQALLHDRVLSTLLAFSQGGVAAQAANSRQARRALELLADPARPSDAPDADEIDERTAVWRLQAAVTELDPLTVFRVLDGPDPSRTVPTVAARVLRESLAEAMRNSLRHASPDGRSVTRLVGVTATSAGITVAIRDDGVGFDVAHVPQARLGIRLSITDRLAALPGGSSRVISRVDAGTLVEVKWSR